MFRGLSVAGLLLGWLCAQGALTDAVQVFAWARMFAGYAQTSTWRAALEQTFDPARPCKICCAVRKAREADQAPIAPVVRESAKLDLVLLATDRLIAPASASATFPSSDPTPTAWHPTVPKPPPRIARAC
jgi:hypothetical protein